MSSNVVMNQINPSHALCTPSPMYCPGSLSRTCIWLMASIYLITPLPLYSVRCSRADAEALPHRRGSPNKSTVISRPKLRPIHGSRCAMHDTSPACQEMNRGAAEDVRVSKNGKPHQRDKSCRIQPHHVSDLLAKPSSEPTLPLLAHGGPQLRLIVRVLPRRLP